MNSVVGLFKPVALWRPDEVVDDPWMPQEAPLVMPRQPLGRDEGPELGRTPATSPTDVNLRRAIVFGGALILAALLMWGPFVLYARKGWQPLEVLGFGVFVMLGSAMCIWFCSALAGLFVLSTGREQDDLHFSPHPSRPRTRTALLMPLYHEDAHAAFARLAALDASLERLGVADCFDIFVLSDSRREDIAHDERVAFMALRSHAHCNLYMRRRADNTERKAGNIADWVRRHGGAYEFMIVLDADSTMAGETVLRLVDAMERHPGVGLIQTAPTIIGARTLFARLSQFGVQMYGRVAAAGLAWWTGSESSYWGHNAILRVRAFAESAGLPVLEGEKPFGGHILSHDVVEGALLRRAGWAVHLTAALDGSCEQTPPTLFEFMRRDERWCQGNLQHLALLNAKGLHPISRLQLFFGCLAYIASPLWFAALVIGLAMQLQYPIDWNSFLYILNPEFTPFMLTTVLSAVLLISPKLMGAALVLSRPRERRAFGGTATILKSVGLEVLLSAILAPIQMVANTHSVMQTFRGGDVGWAPQQRDAGELPWDVAFKAMRWQMVAGLVFAAGLCFRPDLSLCFAPIVLPLLFAAPLAVMTSRLPARRRLRPSLFATPEGQLASATLAVLVSHPRTAPAAR